MTQANQDMTLTAGDTALIRVTVTDGSSAKDLTGATIKYHLARTVNSTADVTKSDGSGIVITDALNGVFEVTLDPADTSSLSDGAYYHEAQVTDASGNVSTVMTGALTLKSGLIS